MRACVFDGRRIRLDESYPEPEPGPGEVPVEVRLAGVCRTDIEVLRGYMGFTGVPGHEFVGTALSGRYEGRRVVGAINCPCGECDLCLDGLPTHCRGRTVLGIQGRDGAFAERLALSEANLVPVPDEVPDEAAVFAEPLAAAIQVTRQVSVETDRNVVVLGDGRLGQLVARVLKAKGADPHVVGKQPAKLTLLEDLGIEAVPAADVRPMKDVGLIVECTGSHEGLAMAMELVRPRGTIVLKSTVAERTGPSLTPVVVDEVTIVGSRCGPMDEAVEMLAGGEVNLEGLVTEEFPLDDAPAALVAAGEPGAIKVLIRP